MARATWKGTVGFGLLHAPVSLYPASHPDEIDFDWLTRDTLQAVGYKRVVKETGEEVDKDNIVRAVKQGDGSYVVLSDEEIEAANVKSTHTVDILSFVEAEDVSFLYFEAPYYLAPAKGGEKVYALLREAMLDARKVGIAQIVMHNKQHLAALIATPRVIVLNTLRWPTEVRSPDDLELPAEGLRAAGVKARELAMAAQLIESMTAEWNPAQYRDTFREDIMALVKRKAEAGKAQTILEVEPQAVEEDAGAGIDLTELLRQSLRGAPRKIAQAEPAAKAPPASRRSAPARSRNPRPAP